MKLSYLGALIFVFSMGLAWYWFSWKLALIIFLAIAGNNIEQHNKE